MSKPDNTPTLAVFFVAFFLGVLAVLAFVNASELHKRNHPNVYAIEQIIPPQPKKSDCEWPLVYGICVPNDGPELTEEEKDRLWDGVAKILDEMNAQGGFAATLRSRR